jgi:hypothetical protein
MGQPTIDDYIKGVNSTDRSKGGAVGKEPLCYRWVRDVLGAPDMRILDFGSGVARTGERLLEAEGFEHVDSYEIGKHVTNLHVKRPKLLSYDIVIMSNVLNVQPTREHILNTVGNALDFLKPGCVCVWNYPQSPRKADLKTSDVVSIMDIFSKETTKLQADVFLSRI